MRWMEPAVGGIASASAGAVLALLLDILYLSAQSLAVASLVGALLGSVGGWCLFVRSIANS